jgi:hypothetical protein
MNPEWSEPRVINKSWVLVASCVDHSMNKRRAGAINYGLDGSRADSTQAVPCRVVGNAGDAPGCVMPRRAERCSFAGAALLRESSRLPSVRATHPAQSRGIPMFSSRPRKRQRRASAR